MLIELVLYGPKSTAERAVSNAVDDPGGGVTAAVAKK